MKINYQNLIVNKHTQIILRFLKEKKLYKNVLNNFLKYYHIIIHLSTNVDNYNKLIQLITVIAYGKNYSLQDKAKLSKNFDKFYFKTIYNKTMEELLDDFLLQNNIYEQFYNNKKKLKPFSTESDVLHINLGRKINEAFEWSKTNEGEQFWIKAHQKLEEYEKKLLYLI